MSVEVSSSSSLGPLVTLSDKHHMHCGTAATCCYSAEFLSLSCPPQVHRSGIEKPSNAHFMLISNRNSVKIEIWTYPLETGSPPMRRRIWGASPILPHSVKCGLFPFWNLHSWLYILSTVIWVIQFQLSTWCRMNLLILIHPRIRKVKALRMHCVFSETWNFQSELGIRCDHK